MGTDQSKRHSSGTRQLGEVASIVVEEVARRTIAEQLSVASSCDDDAMAFRAFREADAIRVRVGQSWSDLLGVGRVNL